MTTPLPTPRLRPVIRVFVSSTFSDMKHERNALQEIVYPKLEQLCQKNGFQFQAIDLRWGVSTEAGLDHRAMRICFEELRRAQEISPKPNFLILLGNRYGWRPLPEEISVTEFEELDKFARAESAEHVEVLRSWYRRDDNAIPPVYILQSRRQDLHNGKDYTQDGVWNEVQAVLWEIINRASPPERLAGRFDQARQANGATPPIVRFQASATEQEIWQGALRVPDAHEHVLAFFREIEDINAVKDPLKIKDFVDVLPSGGLDTRLWDEQKRLKEHLRGKLGAANLFEARSVKLTSDVTRDHLAKLCEDVEARFTQIIQSQIEAYWNKTAQASTERTVRELEIEQQEHARIAQERGGAKTFVGRAEKLQNIRDYLHDDSTSPLVVHGASGCGKTALLARAAQETESLVIGQRSLVGAESGEGQTNNQEQGTKNGAVLCVRFLGTTPRSSDLRGLLTSLCQELRLRWPREGELPTDIKLLEVELQEHFQAAAKSGQPLILFLDALDQLADTDGGRNLHWIPAGPFPAHVKLVASCLSDRVKDDPASQPWVELQKRQLPATHLINLDAFSEDEARTLLFERWLPQAGCTVSRGQRASIEQRLTSDPCRQPIYLKLLFEEARLWRSYDEIPDIGEDVPALLKQLFEWLSRPTNHGPLLVERVLGYLAASREGLAENEILEILFRDPEYKAALDQATEDTHQEIPPNATRIPIAIWSRLRFDLASYLTERAATGANVLTFYHRQVAEWVQEYLAKSHDQRWRPHPLLAEYFTVCAKGTDSRKEWETENVRGFAECVFHLAKAGQHEQAAGLLSSFPFLLHKLRVALLEGVFEDYDMVGLGPVRHPSPNVEICSAFFRERAHILRRGNAEWPAHKILLQLAIEHADDSPLTLGAEGWLGDNHCNWLWLRRVPRLPNAQKNPCLAVLEGHTDAVDGALVLADGRLLSWSRDNTMHLWDTDSGKWLRVFKGRTIGFRGALELTDGQLMSWGDMTLRLWNSKNGECLAVFEGHSDRVRGALALCDGRLLSWSHDTLRLWDARSRACLAVFEGHSNGVRGASTLPDGRLLSWSKSDLRLWDCHSGECLVELIKPTLWIGVQGALALPDGRVLAWLSDGILKIWNGQNGNLLTALEGHTGAVSGVLTFTDGRLLSWAGDTFSKDHTLRLWDSNSGKCLAVLAGHTSYVRGALALSDGRLLSWSDDATLKLWDAVNGKCLAVLEGHTWGINGALVLADGRLLSWSRDNTLRLWDTDSGKCLRVFKGHAWDVRGALVLPDGHVLSWSHDKTLRIWDCQQETSIAELEGHGDSTLIDTLALPNGRVLSWVHDKTLKIWDCSSGDCLVLKGHTSYVVGALTLPDGRLLSWSCDKTLRIWDCGSGACLLVLQGHPDEVKGSLALSNHRVLSWSRDKTLRIWDCSNGACVEVLKGHTDVIQKAIVLGDGRILSWSYDHTMRLWDGVSGSCLGVLEGHTQLLRGILTLSNGRVLSWSDDKTLRLWDERNGACVAVLKGHIYGVWAALPLPGGRLLSWSFDDPLKMENDPLRIWDCSSGACLAVLKGHTGEIQDAIALEDGRILSWSNDGTLRIWNCSSGACLAVLKGHTSIVDGALAISDDRILSWSSFDKTIRLWNSHNGVCLEIVAEEQVASNRPEWLYFECKTQKFKAQKRGAGMVGNFFAIVDHTRTAHLRYRTIPSILTAWNADSESRMCYLLANGTAIVTQVGQVCILRLHHGNRRITLAEAEALVASQPHVEVRR